jgi:hypothetical protein
MDKHCKAGKSLAGVKAVLTGRPVSPMGEADEEVGEGHLVEGLLSHASDLELGLE